MKRPLQLFTSVLFAGMLMACADADANPSGELEPLDSVPSAVPDVESPPATPPEATTPPGEPETSPSTPPETSASGIPDASAAVLLEQGTQVEVELAETVSTESHTAGQSFRGTVAADVIGADGSVVVPAGSEVVGTVIASQPSSGPEEDATLILAVEEIEIDGSPVPVSASVVSADVAGDRRDSTSETVGKVAIGTAAGAILGRILGSDSGDALKGAAAGTIAGAVVAFTTRGGDASAEEGTVLVIQLDEPILA